MSINDDVQRRPGDIVVNRKGHSTWCHVNIATIRSDISPVEPRRGAVGPFDALIAGEGFSETSMFTTPNADWLPSFAVAHSEINTFADGLWGAHEYSRWPQVYDTRYAHVACIPREGGSLAPALPILWRAWTEREWNEVKSSLWGVAAVGQLYLEATNELCNAVDNVIADSSAIQMKHDHLDQKRRFLTLCLRHCVDRLRLLPASRGIIIALAAHVQRLALELVGLGIYFKSLVPRLENSEDCRTRILDVVGAHTADPSVAQRLHHAGVPVWFQQLKNSDVAIWSFDLPKHHTFSTVPSYPKLVLAMRDISGALNTPGEWQRAMTAAVNRQLLSSRLPELMEGGISSDEPRAKKARDETTDTAVARRADEASSLGHVLNALPPRSGRKKSGPSKNTQPSVFFNPFRKYHESKNVRGFRCWSDRLAAAGVLPQPSASVVFFFPPPWLFDTLDGSPLTEQKRQRYVHQLVGIRLFCRLRLFDRTINGRPLTVAEWRHALWGDYTLDDREPSPGTSSATPTASVGVRQEKRVRNRHVQRQQIHRLFGETASLPSYTSAASYVFDGRHVTLDVATNDAELYRILLWEAHETSWRCELLALDALMTGSRNWPEVDQWARESLISEVWGPPRSAMDICPRVESAGSPSPWVSPQDGAWEDGRLHLKAFLQVVQRWPGRPDTLVQALREIDSCDPFRYTRAQEDVVGFYVSTFVEQFRRLPTPPVINPARPATPARRQSPCAAPEMPATRVVPPLSPTWGTAT